MKKSTKIIIGIGAVVAAGIVASAGYTIAAKNLEAVLPEGFTVTAHTGCEGTRDNSLEAIKTGAAEGADIVEFDLSFTDGGEPYLAHDEITKDSVILKAAFETVAKYENLMVNVDCKSVANLKAVAETAEECGVLDRIFYTGIEEKDVDTVKRDTPEVKYYLNRDIDKDKKNDEAYIRSLIEEVKALGAVGLNIHYGGVSKKMTDLFHSEGLKVSVWTVNDEMSMHKILALGCDNITTRQPKKLTEIIDKKVK